MRNIEPPIEPVRALLPHTGLAESRTEILRNGTEVQIRPIQPIDRELERRFIESLSPRSRRFRFLDSLSAPSDALLRQLVDLDPSKDVAYVAVVPVNGRDCAIGVARFSASVGGDDCEFAIAVSDAWQREGLGTLLMHRLIETARARGMETMHSSDLADNDQMRRFGENLHFRRRRDPDDATQLLYSVELTTPQTRSLPAMPVIDAAADPIKT